VIAAECEDSRATRNHARHLALDIREGRRAGTERQVTGIAPVAARFWTIQIAAILDAEIHRSGVKRRANAHWGERWAAQERGVRVEGDAYDDHFARCCCLSSWFGR
jgi:hypothetical protein